MRIKGFSLITLCVILTALPGCDNVYWGGMEMELRSPEPPPSAFVEPEVGEEEERPPEPVRLGALVYLAERSGSEARLLPVAEWRDGEYHPLPGEEETPDLVERFPLERWEDGTEFVLMHQGLRAGTLIADGSVAPDETTCRIRPAGAGRLEVRPEAANAQRFLALRKADIDQQLLPPAALRSTDFPDQISQANLRAGALSVGRYLIPRAEIPWPPSIPDLLVRQGQIGSSDGEALLAATFVFGDEPGVGSAMPTSYSFFTLARSDEDGWSPFWLWFQEARSGKVIPQLLASGSVVEEGSPELILELFGEEARGLAILGARQGEWSLLFRDDCGPSPASGAAGSWP